LAGPDPRDPISLAEGGECFRRPLERDFRRARVAWSANLGGLPVERAVTEVLESQRTTFADLGCDLEEASPDLAGANEAFETLRGVYFANALGELLDRHRALLKDTIVWNVEFGRALTGAQVAAALGKRSQIFERMRRFMERYEFLIAPVSQVTPFPVEQPYVTRIEEVEMKTYLDPMRSCSAITVTGHPAIAVPCGFTPEGLPVGIQIVGRYRDELGILQLARAFEASTQMGRRRPPGTSVLPEPSR
jgi:amidase